MHERELGMVLMVKAFEEQDPAGALLPPADRESAAREAARKLGATAPPQDLLAERARILYSRIAGRHPVVEHVRKLASGFAGLGWMLALAGLAAGAALSALDGPRRIEIVLSWSLLGLLLWNAAVYAFLLARAVPRRNRATSSLFRAAIARFPGSLATRAIAKSRAFDTTLAGALDRFVRAWFDLAAPVNRARAAAAFHWAAVAVGLGLVAGLYLRGLGLDYRAGWETTFLSPEAARQWIGILYGPAAALSNIALPDAARLQAIRWPAGEPAARWMHLIAITVLLWVVVPRLLLAAMAALAAWRQRRALALPPGLDAYFRGAFGNVESIVPRQVARVIPYANALGSAALLRLAAWIPEFAGGKVDVDAAEPIPYGEEQRHLDALPQRAAGASLLVLPFGLATTPEDENHGAVIEGVRDWAAAQRGVRVLVVVDEAPFRERMAGAPERIDERRKLWRDFVAARGLEASFVSLAG